MSTDREKRRRVQSDPMASAKDILWLQQQDVRAALMHPNCPLALWWELAEKYPIEAQASPAGKLFLLEDPSRWAKLEETNYAPWIKKFIKLLSLEQRYLFAVDCAEHVKRFFEFPDQIYFQGSPDRRHSEAKIISRALEVCRQFARGKATKEELAAAQDAVHEIARHAAEVARGANTRSFHGQHREGIPYRAASYAAQSAEYALNCAKAKGEKTAWRAAQDAAKAHGNSELKWQWERLHQYLKGNEQ